MMAMMNFTVISTELMVLALAMILTAVDLILPEGETRRSIGYIAIAGLASIFAYALRLYDLPEAQYFYHYMFVLDNYALFFKLLFIVAVGFTILFSLDYVDAALKNPGEYYALLLFALLGMMTMVSANDFLTMFIGLELMAVSFYILVGYKLGDPASSEAGIKYLITGAASTAVMLYGISFVYGCTETLLFDGIYPMSMNLFSPGGFAGIALIVVGMMFKLSVIPFHMWAPDVYHGAPTPVTALLAMGSKGAALAVFMRLLFSAFPIVYGYWDMGLALFAALCMIAGNVMALAQTNVKRMLAYSSIAQVGYMLSGVAATSGNGMKGTMFYMLIYVFANIGAFAVLSAVDYRKGGTDLKHMAGLSRTAPVLAAVMSVSLLSMAGIPPTAGFVGKLYVFSAAVENGYIGLAFIGFVMSMVSVYYYLQVVKNMYLVDAEDREAEWEISGSLRAAVIISAAITVVVGVYPEHIAQMANIAVATFK